MLLRGGGGAAREAEGLGDGFGVLCVYERHEGKGGPMSTVRGVRLWRWFGVRSVAGPLLGISISISYLGAEIVGFQPTCVESIYAGCCLFLNIKIGWRRGG